MQPADTDDLFRRFATTADTRALAAFYDRVAPELLLVAVHLGAPGGEAEDLVQATFLAAIERVGSYDPRRPAMPWLIGILVNQGRRARRRRDRVADAERVEGAAEVDPARAAEDAELAEHLGARLRALPAGYREAMTLRFVHGLMPVQIAHALGVPPDTVKTRLRRGTEMLRRALPVGFASAMAAVVTPARGLAAVRAVVLGAAAARTAQRSGTLTGALFRRGWRGWLAASGLGLVLTAVAVLVLTSRPRDGDLGPAPPEPLAGGPVPAAPQAGAGEGRVDAVVAPPARQAAPAGEGLGRARVHVRYHDGTPAAGVSVAFTPRQGQDPLLHRRWLVADGDGTVQAEVPAGVYALAADRGGEAELDVAGPGEAETTLTVPVGVQLRGRVHAAGTPVAGAALWLSFDDRPDEGHLVATTATDGTFALRDVAKGRTFSVRTSGYVSRPLALIDAPLGAVQEADVDLDDLRSRTELRGRVVDAAGASVPGARLQLGRRLPHFAAASAGMGRDALVPPIELVADADGRFDACGFVVFDRILEVWCRAPGFAPLEEKVSFQSSRSRDVTLTLARGVELHGRVTTVGGAPVAGATVQARGRGIKAWEHAPRWAAAEAIVAADGRFRLAGLPPGHVVVEARGRGGTRADAILDPASQAELTLELAPPRTILGVVRDETGAACPGLEVRARVGPGRRAPAAAPTAADGTFALLDCDGGPHILAVVRSGAWPGALATRADVHAGPGQCELTVPRGALGTGGLRARVVDEHGVAVEAKVAVGQLRSGYAFATSDPVSGTFRIGPLPSCGASWFVLVEDARGRQVVRDGVAVPPEGDVDLGDLVVRPGVDLDVEIEAPDGAAGPSGPARARVALSTGLPIAAVELRDGKGTARSLPPGDYVVHLVSETLAQTPVVVRVEPGEKAKVVLRPPATSFVRSFAVEHPVDDDTLRLDLCWCDATGERRCVDRVEWTRAAPLACRQAFAPGSYRLQVVSQSGRSGEVTFEVGPGLDIDPVVVELR